MAEEGGGGKGDGKKGDVSVCRDFLRNVCTRGDRCESMLSGGIAKLALAWLLGTVIES